MAAGQPIFSIVMTAGIREILTLADFNVSTPFYAHLSNVEYLTMVEVSYDYTATAGPHELVISPDYTKTAIGSPTADPLWCTQVFARNQTPPTGIAFNGVNRLIFNQPLQASAIDFYFQTAVFPGAGYFRPTAVRMCVEYYPSRLT